MSNKRLLIVDDDAPLRKRLSRAMEQRGFIVSQAESVAEASQYMNTEEPDYAVVDLKLEDGSGLSVVERLKQRYPKMPHYCSYRLWKYCNGCCCGKSWRNRLSA